MSIPSDLRRPTIEDRQVWLNALADGSLRSTCARFAFFVGSPLFGSLAIGSPTKTSIAVTGALRVDGKLANGPRISTSEGHVPLPNGISRTIPNAMHAELRAFATGLTVTVHFGSAPSACAIPTSI